MNKRKRFEMIQKNQSRFEFKINIKSIKSDGHHETLK